MMMDLPPIPGESLVLGSALVFVLSLLLTEIVVGMLRAAGQDAWR
jgi:hypothetical protein